MTDYEVYVKDYFWHVYNTLYEGCTVICDHPKLSKHWTLQNGFSLLFLHDSKNYNTTTTATTTTVGMGTPCFANESTTIVK